MERAKSDLLQFIRRHRFAVLSTVSVKNEPQSALVGIAATDAFEIIFDTVESSRKIPNIRKNQNVAFVIGGWTPGEERTVQYEGVAYEPTGRDLDGAKRVYYQVFPDGPTRLARPGLVYIKVRPTWIRFSNFKIDPPEIAEFNF